MIPFRKPQEIETIMDDFVDKVINQKTPIVKPGSGKLEQHSNLVIIIIIILLGS